MADCKKYKQRFEKSLYEDLYVKDQKDLELHLADCKSCELEYNELKATLES